jgi:membrane protein YdbS with pleckstrin-like domain
MRQAIDNMAMERAPFGWTVAAFAVLLRAVRGGLLNRIMGAREWSTILGSAIVILLLSKLAMVAYLWQA